MSEIPGRLMKEDLLIVDPRGKVSRVLNVDYTLPGNLVVLSLKDQMTGDLEERSVPWEKRLFCSEGLEVPLDGPRGVEGKVRVELAQVAPPELYGTSDDRNRNVYRYEILDRDGEVIHEEANIRSGVGERIDTKRVMSALLSYMEAAGEAWDRVSSGQPTENDELFPPHVMQFCAHNSTEIQIAALELNEGRSAADG